MQVDERRPTNDEIQENCAKKIRLCQRAMHELSVEVDGIKTRSPLSRNYDHRPMHFSNKSSGAIKKKRPASAATGVPKAPSGASSAAPANSAPNATSAPPPPAHSAPPASSSTAASADAQGAPFGASPAVYEGPRRPWRRDEVLTRENAPSPPRGVTEEEFGPWMWERMLERKRRWHNNYLYEQRKKKEAWEKREAAKKEKEAKKKEAEAKKKREEKK